MAKKTHRVDAPLTKAEKDDFRRLSKAAGRSMRSHLRFLITQAILKFKYNIPNDGK